MAFCNKNQFKTVPWMSPDEWRLVYKQIYSNDIQEQRKGYKTLLVWRARISTLPAGVDCTLELLNVGLKDRGRVEELDTSNLDFDLEDELQRGYGYAILRVVNHITNLVEVKESSMYKICKNMKIPKWIVDLRHDVAHGVQTAPLAYLKDATNFLFDWLRTEYWIPASKLLEEEQEKSLIIQRDETIEHFADSVEVWVAIKLYIKVGYKNSNDIPNEDLRKWLLQKKFIESSNDTKICENGDIKIEKHHLKWKQKKLKKLNKLSEANLEAIQQCILDELSTQLNKKPIIKNKYSNAISNTLLDNEVFLPDQEFLAEFSFPLEKEKMTELPEIFLEFWKDLIFMMHRKNILQFLFIKLHKIVQNESMNKMNRLMASLWIKALIQATNKQIFTQKVSLAINQVLDSTGRTLKQSQFDETINKCIMQKNPKFKDTFALNYKEPVLVCLKAEEFLKTLVIEVNEYAVHYIPSVLELMEHLTEKKKKDILEILELFTNGPKEGDIFDGKIYSVEDLNLRDIEEMNDEDQVQNADMTHRNPTWKLAEVDIPWDKCSVGILPGQKGFNYFKLPSVKMINNDYLSTFSPGMSYASQNLGKSQMKKIVKSDKNNKMKHSDEDNATKRIKK